MIVHTPAFVLRHYRLRETSLIISLYTREIGKIKGVCKGVRDLKSRKTGHFEILTHLDATIYIKPNRDLQLVSDTSILNFYPDVKGELPLSLHASYIAELVDKLTQENLPSDIIYRLLATYLGLLTADNVELFTLAFELKLLKTLGIFPNFGECMVCHEQMTKSGTLIPHLGGVVCDREGCYESEGVGYFISEELIALAYALIRLPFPEINQKLIREEKQKLGLKRLVRVYLDSVTNRSLKSVQVLEEVMSAS